MFCFDELLLILWRACQDVSPRDLRIASATNDTDQLLNKILVALALKHLQLYAITQYLGFIAGS